jgi:A/G-specific adenine glycosylase
MDDLTAMTTRVVEWYDEQARDLPWRDPSASAWAVMVSEFMLQQTPVARVLPVYEQWLERWPTPAALAAVPAGEAVRAWGRLGYPRRAQRLHAAAVSIVDRHGGQVPSSYDELRALPGVGDYTAAAIATFAHGRRHVVLDTNVRRVLARLVSGIEFPATTVTKAARTLAESVLPEESAVAARWSVAAMELGALVCTAAKPDCARCPVVDVCRWQELGRPPYDGPPRRGQTYAGTDRQCRGRILAVLRGSAGPVHRSRIDAAWTHPEQRERCLAGLLDDGLVTRSSAETYTL